MKKFFLLGSLVLFVLLGAAFILRFSTPEDDWVCENGRWVKHGNPDAPAPGIFCGALVEVESPATDEKVSSPLFVSGRARGVWFFEASFPVELTDENDNILARGIATAKDDWMTEEFVPFEAKLEFEKPSSDSGFLILKKDNPSGLPENDDFMKIPVRF